MVETVLALKGLVDQFLEGLITSGEVVSGVADINRRADSEQGFRFTVEAKISTPCGKPVILNPTGLYPMNLSYTPACFNIGW